MLLGLASCVNGVSEEQSMGIRCTWLLHGCLVKAQGVNVFQSDTPESHSKPLGSPGVARVVS